MPKLHAAEIDKTIADELPPAYAKKLKRILGDLDKAIAEKGLKSRAVYHPQSRSVELEGTSFSWRLDNLPPDVLLAEATYWIDYLVERNPLERYRLYHRLSYGELGKRLGMMTGTVHAYCTNINSPSWKRRDEIANATGGEVPADADWPLPPRGAHRPVNPASRNQQKLANRKRGPAK